MKKIIIILLLISLNLVAKEKEKNSDDIDHVALAALLLRDGHLSRAGDELNQVNLKDKNIDLVRYYTLKGIVLSKQGFFENSNNFFNLSIDAGQEDKSIYLYIAQNSYKLHNYLDALDAIDKAGVIADNKPSIYALKAECLWKLGRTNPALDILKSAIIKFPETYSFYKQRFNYLVTVKLYQSALADANIYLKYANPNEQTTISFIAALRKSGETDKAIKLAESANLKFLSSAKVTVLLAHLYLDKDMIQSAAELFNEASIEDSKYTNEAAEMMRRAKKFIMALYINAQMLNSKEKLKQRIAIYLEYGSYEKIVVSHNALKRSGLLNDDENIRYALAYAYYKSNNFPSCEKELTQLTSSNLFKKATELRKNMQKCKVNYWECDL